MLTLMVSIPTFIAGTLVLNIFMATRKDITCIVGISICLYLPGWRDAHYQHRGKLLYVGLK